VLFGAQRELWEETGISAGWSLLRHVYTGMYQGPSGLREVTCFEIGSVALPFITLDTSPEGLVMVWLDWSALVQQSPFGEFYGRCGAPNVERQT